MERLTYKDSTLPRKNDCGKTIEAYSDYEVRDIINRLAAYEDTGLEPEEIEDALSRFSELLCYLTNNHMSKTNYTMGAMLSEIEDVRQEACERYCDLKQAEQDGRLLVLPCKVGDKVYANTRSKVSSFEVKGFFIRRDGDIFVRWNLLDGIYGPHRMDGFTPDKIGKTVFLTRAEADAAMKGVSEDG